MRGPEAIHGRIGDCLLCGEGIDTWDDDKHVASNNGKKWYVTTSPLAFQMIAHKRCVNAQT